MRILFLDLASASPYIALCTKDSVLASNMPDHRLGDHELLPAVNEMFRVSGFGFRDLTHIACTVGPGGFMSIRTGVAFVNAMADQLGISLAGVHLSDVYAARIRDSGFGIRDYFWLHSTKKQELFVRGFGEYAKKWPEAMHVTIGEFADVFRRDATPSRLYGNTNIPYVGELIPEQCVALEPLGLHPTPLRAVSDVLPSFLQNQEYKKQILEPWYGRGW